MARMLFTSWLVAPWTLVALLACTERPYVFDLASHFLLHAAALCLVCGALLLALRRWWSGANLVLVGMIIAGGWRVSAPTPVAPAAPEGVSLRLIEFNMQSETSRHDNEAVAWLRDQRADIIVLVEPPFGLLNDYPFLRKEYPYSVEPAPGLMWEIVLLSRFPAEVHPIIEYSEATKFSFASRRSLLVHPPGASPFLLSAMHPPSPRTPRTWERALNGMQLDGPLLRQWRERTQLPVIVAGDFNSTPVGRVHRSFAQKSGLRGWSLFFGGGTWPARLPPWISIPIDRVWTSPEVHVRSIDVGPRFRSDHRPIVTAIEIPASPKQLPSDDAPSEPKR